MKKFSASYNYINPNFVIDNLQEGKNKSELLSVFSVCQNVINRSVNTRPSFFLKERIPYQYSKEDRYVIPLKTPNWQETIKGGDTINPALEFYNSKLQNALGGNKCLFSSFIPECLFTDVVNTKSTNEGSSIDFYSPLLKLAIEIDGKQHQEDEQLSKDRERDEQLLQSRIETVRITTSELNYGVIFKLDRAINKHITESQERVKKFVDAKNISDDEKAYMLVIRFQILLLELLKANMLSFDEKDWRLNVYLQEEVSSEVLEYAFEDLWLLIQSVATLQGFNLTKPNFYAKVVDEDMLNYTEGLNINISLFNNYEEHDNHRIIYIANDYFQYNEDADSKELAPSFKNHFKVSCAKFKYSLDINNVKQHEALLFILKTVFAFDSFLPNQEEIIVNCLNRQSVIGLLPTSAGKSLCYQMSAMLIPSASLVICPLKSLMEDQYNNLCEYGLSNVLYYNSSNKTKSELLENNRSIISLISPERFFSVSFTDYLTKYANNFSLIAIDEVHCLSEWGHDFRTSYLCLLHSLKKYFDSDCCLIGLTATASPNVSEDIVAEFNTFRPNTLIITAETLSRPELTLSVIKCKNDDEKDKWLKEFIDKNENFSEKTIVFTKFANSKQDKSSCLPLCLDAQNYTRIKSPTIDYYSSEKNNKSEETNSSKLQNFKNGDTKLLFSTKAFGMGVNIPDIRDTVHYGLPSSIESLYQEFGRAGRDKQPSKCYILFNEEKDRTIDKLADRDVKISNLKSIQADCNELRGNLWFVTNSNNDVEAEVEELCKFYNYLDYSKISELRASDIPSDFFQKPFQRFSYYDSYGLKEIVNADLNKVERGLYRLFLIGLIDLWSIVYSSDIENPIFKNIKVKNIPLVEVKEKLENYIRRYEFSYEYKGEITVKALLNELISWSYKNFTLNRIESLRKLYEYCNTYTTSDSLMFAITQYLTTDAGLRGIIENENSPRKWFEYMESIDAESRKHKLDRYLESYHSSTALDYISALTRLELDDFDSPDGEKRFRESLQKIVEYSDENKRTIIRQTFNFAKKLGEADVLVPIVYEYMPEQIRDIYTITESELACALILQEYIKKLDKIGEELNGKYRKD